MQLTSLGLKKPDQTDPVDIQDLNDNADIINAELNNRPTKTGDAGSMITNFTVASSRTDITSGETVKKSFGKIKKWFTDLTAAAFAQVITSYPDLMANTVPGYLADALAVKEGLAEINSNLDKISYPYPSFTNQKLQGMITKPQNDSAGYGNRYLIFIPIHHDNYIQYGVSKIKDIIIQGIIIIRQNETDKNGYQIVNADHSHQAIILSVVSSSDLDISGYLCDCNFDFYRV